MVIRKEGEEEWLGANDVRYGSADEAVTALAAFRENAHRSSAARLAEIEERKGSGNRSSSPEREKPLRATQDAFEFDVALSFAGEQRAYVESVAEHLGRSGISIFYDKYEQIELWGKNVHDELTDIYENRSLYVVLFASKDYVEKAWTNVERQSALSRAMKSDREYILPARFDDTPIPGLPDSVGYIDLRSIGPREFASKIVKKLRTPPAVTAEEVPTATTTSSEESKIEIYSKMPDVYDLSQDKRILKYVVEARDERTNVSALAVSSGIPEKEVGAIVRSLEANGLIQRSQTESGLRFVPTSAGVHLLKKALQVDGSSGERN